MVIPWVIVEVHVHDAGGTLANPAMGEASERKAGSGVVFSVAWREVKRKALDEPRTNTEAATYQIST